MIEHWEFALNRCHSSVREAHHSRKFSSSVLPSTTRLVLYAIELAEKGNDPVQKFSRSEGNSVTN